MSSDIQRRQESSFQSGRVDQYTLRVHDANVHTVQVMYAVCQLPIKQLLLNTFISQTAEEQTEQTIIQRSKIPLKHA